MRKIAFFVLFSLCLLGCKQRSQLQIHLDTASGHCLWINYLDTGYLDEMCYSDIVYEGWWEGEYDIQIGIGNNDVSDGYYITHFETEGAECEIGNDDTTRPTFYNCTIVEPKSLLSIAVGQ